MIDLSQSTTFKRDYRLFLVDTPGFNDCDPKRTDSLVLQAILNWVHEWCVIRQCGVTILIHILE